MLVRLRPTTAVLFLLAASGCQTTYDNPFLPPAAAPVPAGATLLYVGNAHGATGNGPRELFAVDDRGGAPTRLTTCTNRSPPCEVVQVAPAPDRSRVAVRRRVDSNRNGVVESTEDDGIYVVDLARGVEGRSIPPKGISSIDWSPVEDLFAYGARGQGGLDDLYSSHANGSDDRNLTGSADVNERGFRFAPGGLSVLVYERSQPGQRSEIWFFRSTLIQGRLSSGGTERPPTPLPGTPYVVGSDADPDISPDLTSVVFRRLTGLGENGRGTWDIMTVGSDGTGLRTIVAGPAYRSAPDWGPNGIVFAEIPVGGPTGTLLVVDRDGGSRRTVLTQPSLFALESPRWLP